MNRACCRALVALLLALCAMPVAYAQGDRERLRVFHVQTALAMRDDPAPLQGPDYYIDGGDNAGLESGMLLDVRRPVSVQDRFTGRRIEAGIRFATLRVVRVYPQMAIARVESIEPASDGPIVTPRAVMIGDRVARQPEPVAKPARISLPSRLLFPLDSAELSEAGRQELSRVESMLSGFAGSLRIEGHTCDLGTELYNLDLSRRRAQAVAAALKAVEGFPEARISIAALGETSPSVPNDGEKSRGLNRRVDLVFQPDAEMAVQIEIEPAIQVAPSADPPVRAVGHPSPRVHRALVGP